MDGKGPSRPCPGCGHADANHEPTGRGICLCCATEATRRKGSCRCRDPLCPDHHWTTEKGS